MEKQQKERKQNMKKLVVALIVILGLSVALPFMNIDVEASTNSVVDSLKEEQKELEKRNKELDKKKKEAEKSIEKNKKKQKEIMKEIEELDKELSETEIEMNEIKTEIQKTQREIDSLSKEIDKLETEINKLNEEIEVVQKRIDIREEILTGRLRSMQQTGEISYLQVLFGSSSFQEFISTSAALKTIVNSDKNIVEEQLEDKRKLESMKEEVEDKMTALEDEREEVEKKEKQLEVDLKAMEELQKKLKEQSKEKDELLNELMDEQDELLDEQMSAEEEQKLLEEQSKFIKVAIEQYQNNGGSLVTYGKGSKNGVFVLPAHGTLTSKFGMRIHPISGVPKLHAGIDVAAPTGTPIIAAGSGTVTAAHYMSGFGNAVFIYHPQHNLTSVYAHMSRIDVSAGQKVEVGQTIGAIGNTGKSTGPHLHFEVHIGQYSGSSSAVDPAGYIR